MTVPEQHANTVERLADVVRDQLADEHHPEDQDDCPYCRAIVALDALIVLAERADTLERELGEATKREWDYHNLWHDETDKLEQARAEADRLREAIAEALTSLATGPGKDGYAYAVLDAALAGPQTEAPHDFPADYTGWRPLP